MKEQIRETLEGMTVGNLKELKNYFKSVKEDAEVDLKIQLLDSEIRDKRAIADTFYPIIAILGIGEVIEIIEDIEKERKEKWNI